MMRFVTAIILVSLLCAVVLLSSGCVQQGRVVGVADTNSERQQRLKDAHNIGWRQLVDDWDAFWLQDRGSRLSEYPIR